MSYEYLSSLYTLSHVFPVCCRRACYEMRVHPKARTPEDARWHWNRKRFPKNIDLHTPAKSN